ncbi:MAG TPA: T9SS type A sorting domain-containing protein [Saprospiraceae bacterium]
MRYTIAFGFLVCIFSNLRSQCSFEIELTTQGAVDNFSCDSVLTLKISGPGITNLNGLLGLRHVEKDLWITDTQIQNLAGLDSLAIIDEFLLIRDNPSLVNLEGLEKATGLNTVTIHRNPSLENLNGLNNVEGIYDLKILENNKLVNMQGLEKLKNIFYLSLRDNNGLQTLHGLHSISQVAEHLQITNNPYLISIDGIETINVVENVEIFWNQRLTHLDALRYLTRIRGWISLLGNASLVDIRGLNNITRIDGDIEIINNASLSDCAIRFFCNRFTNGGITQISDNATGCKSITEVLLSCSEHHTLAQGSLFLDHNCNNVQEAGEYELGNQMIFNHDLPLTNTLFDGRFQALLNNNETHIIYPFVNSNFHSIPANYEITTDTTLQLYDNLDFALCPDTLYHDLGIHLAQLSELRRGFKAKYRLCLENAGVYIEDPVVILSFDDHPAIEIIDAFGGEVNGNTITWEFNGFTALADYCFEVVTSVDQDAMLGEEVIVKATIAGNIPIDEISYTNNEALRSGHITGSYDPNDKIVNRTEIPPSQEETVLEYTIRFQNTGNSYAEFVEVIDTLEAGLDVRSIQMIDASHAYQLSFPDSNVVKWRFDNILLPDSTTNEPESHGFVHFAISTKDSLLLNSEIKNECAIYFDFNDPVITAPAVTLVKLSTSVDHQNRQQYNLCIYPNPTSDQLFLNVTINSPDQVKMDMVHLNGKVIINKEMDLLQPGQHTFSLDTSTVPAGMYFIHLSGNKGRISQKVFVFHGE